MNAQQRYGAALDAHSAFLTARVEATRRIGAPDSRGKAPAAADEEEELVNPKFLKRKLPEPAEGWKDAAGKPHRAHASSAAFCKRASWLAWRLLDVLRESAEADPDNADERNLVKEVKLQKLIPIEVLKEKEATIKVRKLIEYLLNDINEYSTALYLRHVHGQAVADLFAGDDLYGVDMSLPIHERVEKAKKQVAKDRANATLAAAARGVSAGGKRKSGGRGRGGRQQQQQQQRQPFNNSHQSGGMGRGGGGGNGGGTGGVIGGATGGYQAPVCYGCGASGHIQRNCPNNK
jgi:hypothetical protein